MTNKIGLVLGIICLFVSIIFGTMYYNTKKKTKELVRQGELAMVALEKTAKIKEDSILLEVKKRDSTIKELSTAQEQSKKSLNQVVKMSKNLSAEVVKAKVHKDTTTYYAKCDSLAEQVVVLEAENYFYQNKVDLLNLNYLKQLATKDTLIKAKDELYSKLRTAFDGSILKISELNNDKEKLSLKLERSKRTSRLIAIIGAGVAGTIYLTTR